MDTAVKVLKTAFGTAYLDILMLNCWIYACLQVSVF